MAKRKRKPKTTDIFAAYGLPNKVAQMVGISRQRLEAAVVRRDPILDIHTLCCGRDVVSRESAEEYAKNPPSRGRVSNAGK